MYVEVGSGLGGSVSWDGCSGGWRVGTSGVLRDLGGALGESQGFWGLLGVSQLGPLLCRLKWWPTTTRTGRSPSPTSPKSPACTRWGRRDVGGLCGDFGGPGGVLRGGLRHFGALWGCLSPWCAALFSFEVWRDHFEVSGWFGDSGEASPPSPDAPPSPPIFWGPPRR